MQTSTITVSCAQSYRRRPWLICLDLQREYVVPGRALYDAGAAEVAQACSGVLALARASDWRVIHCQMRREASPGRRLDYFGAPIEGLRPLISEPVYMRDGLSAFTNPDFAAKLREARGDDVYLIGFSLADTCLATVMAAVDYGLSLTLVIDAIGAGAASVIGVAQIARTLLRPFVRTASSNDLTHERLEAWQ
jgi:nicotinamidase-related amidase